MAKNENNITEEKTFDPYEGKNNDWSSMLLRKKLTIASYRINMIPKKKSGHNDKLNYNYFKLGDIMPAILKICAEMGIFHRTYPEGNQLKLIIQNADKPDDEEFVSAIDLKPISLMGHNPMQEQGASITYARRGLYTMAFDIEDEEELDLVQGDNQYNSYSTSNNYNSAQAPQCLTNEQEDLIKKLFTVLYKDNNYQKSATKVLKSFGLSNLNGLRSYLDVSKANQAIDELSKIYQKKKAEDKEAEKQMNVDETTGEVKKTDGDQKDTHDKTTNKTDESIAVQEKNTDHIDSDEIVLGDGDSGEEITIIDVDEIEGLEAFN